MDSFLRIDANTYLVTLMGSRQGTGARTPKHALHQARALTKPCGRRPAQTKPFVLPAGAAPGKLGVLKLRDGQWALAGEYEGGVGGTIDKNFNPHGMDRNGDVLVTADYIRPDSVWARFLGLVIPMCVYQTGRQRVLAMQGLLVRS